jgi:hypothetical protein
MESSLYQPLVSQQIKVPWWQKAWLLVKSILSVPPPSSTQNTMTTATATAANQTETEYQAYEEP